MRDEIEAAFSRVLKEVCPPTRVREIEGGEDPGNLWRALEETGFIDALVPEAEGGVGLQLTDAAPVILLAGRHAIPLPIAETMVCRSLVAGAGIDVPAGAIAFGGPVGVHDGQIACSAIGGGAAADTVVVRMEGEARLMPAGEILRREVPLATDVVMRWPRTSWSDAPVVGGADGALRLHALACAGLSAGALETVLTRTLEYANERTQFGRPIGKFQAIQHQLAVAAEHVFAARMAFDVACAAPEDTSRVAIAKSRSGQAAHEVSALAHSIHGAIGFTAEFDLQLYTRRLHFWRQSAGGEAYWNEVLGQTLLGKEGPVLDFMRHASEVTRPVAVH